MIKAKRKQRTVTINRSVTFLDWWFCINQYYCTTNAKP